MANLNSQRKRNARTERERLENRHYTSAAKTYQRRLEDAVEAGDAEKADRELRNLLSTIDKAVAHGAMHRNTGARRKSRAERIRAGA
ncbi:MAG: 30S ribosomal protein S20 [Acidobacteria bacterium]|nr:30S ribosomal protein S20 [Solirubrobacteraceae bacterium]MBU6338327.1 30S ribosomal protein S20 [Acidobacteriota bacterium]